jgi:hypothetical protein
VLATIEQGAPLDSSIAVAVADARLGAGERRIALAHVFYLTGSREIRQGGTRAGDGRRPRSGRRLEALVRAMAVVREAAGG